MEPEQSDQGKRFDPEAIARQINEEHAKAIRDLADWDEGREDAFARATQQVREINAEVPPESARQAIRDIEELRESEGYIEY